MDLTERFQELSDQATYDEQTRLFLQQMQTMEANRQIQIMQEMQQMSLEQQRLFMEQSMRDLQQHMQHAETHNQMQNQATQTHLEMTTGMP